MKASNCGFWEVMPWMEYRNLPFCSLICQFVLYLKNNYQSFLLTFFLARGNNFCWGSKSYFIGMESCSDFSVVPRNKLSWSFQPCLFCILEVFFTTLMNRWIKLTPLNLKMRHKLYIYLFHNHGSHCQATAADVFGFYFLEKTHLSHPVVCITPTWLACLNTALLVCSDLSCSGGLTEGVF